MGSGLKIRLLIGKKSLLFSGYQGSCSLPALCHAAEAVVMAISSAVMDSVCDNSFNTLSVLFTLSLTFPAPGSSSVNSSSTFHPRMCPHMCA